MTASVQTTDPVKPASTTPTADSSTPSRENSPPASSGWRRAGSIAKFLGIALIGFGVIAIGLAENAASQNNGQAVSNDFTLTFILGGVGVIVLGLGFLLAALDRP